MKKTYKSPVATELRMGKVLLTSASITLNKDESISDKNMLLGREDDGEWED